MDHDGVKLSMCELSRLLIWGAAVKKKSMKGSWRRWLQRLLLLLMKSLLLLHEVLYDSLVLVSSSTLLRCDDPLPLRLTRKDITLGGLINEL
jgi:hypothetical protein